jgi:hypothetical protein
MPPNDYTTSEQFIYSFWEFLYILYYDIINNIILYYLINY